MDFIGFKSILSSTTNTRLGHIVLGVSFVLILLLCYVIYYVRILVANEYRRRRNPAWYRRVITQADYQPRYTGYRNYFGQ